MPDKSKKLLKTTKIKDTNVKPQQPRKIKKAEPDCIIVEPQIEVIEVVEEDKRKSAIMKSANTTKRTLKPDTPKWAKAKASTSSIESNGSAGLNRRRSLRLLAMKHE